MKRRWSVADMEEGGGTPRIRSRGEGLDAEVHDKRSVSQPNSKCSTVHGVGTAEKDTCQTKCSRPMRMLPRCGLLAQGYDANGRKSLARV